MRTLALALALALCTSCSWRMMSRPPPAATWRSDVEPACSTSAGPAIADIAGALMMPPLAVLPFTGDGTSSDGEVITLWAMLGAGAVAFIASSVHGFRVASACEDAKRSWAATRATLRPLWQPADGAERGRCRPVAADACNPGLACASGLCVRPPEPAPRWIQSSTISTPRFSSASPHDFRRQNRRRRGAAQRLSVE
jgi:hypothetical protein